MKLFAYIRKQSYPPLRKKQKVVFALILLVTTFALSLPGVAYADFCDFLRLGAIPGPQEICEAIDFIRDPVEGLAQIANLVLGVPLALLLTLLTGLLYFITAVLGTLFVAASSVMVDFIHATMEIGVIPGAQGAELVDEGFRITRNLVNILFLLILVFIGLATILRRGDYQAQKALPMLILIALLVNFSPLLVGFVVDMGNILTNAFLDEITGLKGFGLLGDQLKDMGEGFLKLIKSVFQDPQTSLPIALDLLIQVVVAGLYYFLAYLIVFIIMVIFFLRTIVLWVLTILAPLAFAAYILPATRQMWSQWFKNLIQWAFIGVPISFFLLLAAKLQTLKTAAKLSPLGADQIGDLTVGLPAPLVPEDPSILSLLIVNVIGNFAVLIVMAVGIFVSMQFVPQGAQGAIDFGKNWGGKAAAAAGTAALRYRGAPSKKIGRFRLGMDTGVGEKLEQFGGGLRRFGTRVSPEERRAMEEGIEKSIEDKEAQAKWLTKQKDEGIISPQEHGEKTAALTEDIKKLQEEGENLPAEHRKGAGRVTDAGVGFFARWAGRGVELGTGELVRRMKGKDEREIGEGTAEGTGKDSRDLARQINQELAKGALKNQNRIIGLLNAMVKNNDSDDLQKYMREGLLDPKQIGAAIADAQRGGPPAYRPLMKAVYGRMLSNPDQFGENFAAEKDENGEIKRQADGITPVLVDKKIRQGWVNEVKEKLSAADITAKILGDTLDKGKAGGREFVEHGGELVVKNLVSVRGQLSGPLLTRPESQEGRQEVGRLIMETVNEALRTYEQEARTNAQAAAQKLSDKLTGGLGAALASLAGPGAQNAGVSFPAGPGDVRNFNKAIAAEVAGQPFEQRNIDSIVTGVRDAANALTRQTTGAARGGPPPSPPPPSPRGFQAAPTPGTPPSAGQRPSRGFQGP